MSRSVTRREDWGELGPAMRALSERHRLFVEFYVWETFTNKNRDHKCAKAAAARKAGYGTEKSTPSHLANIGWRLLRDDKIIGAVSEESKKYRRTLLSKAIKAMENGIGDPTHKDHARFVAMQLDRSDPIISHQQIDVTHRSIDPDQEAIEELRALRSLGTSREKLLELFGGNGLARLERLEAADTAQRAQNAKVIDGEAVEIETENANG